MISAILNSAIMDSAILHLLSFLKKNLLIHSHSTWWYQPSWILPSWIQLFCTKKNFTHSFWLNLMIAAMLKSAILDSAILHKKNFTHSFSLNLMMQPSWILPSWIHPFCTKKKTSLIYSDSTWWWQPSWILPCWIQTLPSWIQTPWYLLSDSLKNTLTPFWLWLKLIQSDSNSFILTHLDDSAILNSAIMDSSILHQKNFTHFILTQLDDGSHLEFCHVGFRHLVIFPQLPSKTLFLHSDSDLKLIPSD